MINLQDKVQNFSDEQLLDAYSQRSEYTDEAVHIFEEEITRRCLDLTAAVAEKAREARSEIASRKASAGASECADALAKCGRDDFVPLECVFAKADVLTANSILHDSDVPYAIEEVAEDASGADDDSAGKDRPAMFSVLIYKDAIDKARALIAEHFDACPDGVYAFRASDDADRLKAFSFSDIRISDDAAREEFDVDFSESERASLVKFANLLLDEADKIEEEQGRVIFFYDSMEPLIEKLDGGGRLTRQDFLAIIELCQAYCGDPRYDKELNRTASSIISFFLT